MHLCLLSFLSNSHMFTRAGSNPSMHEVIRQEGDEEESQREVPSSFEILAPVQALPLTPYSSHKTWYLFIFDSSQGCLEKPAE